MTPDQMIAVIQAAKEGKPIQARRARNCDARWYVCEDVTFNFTEFEYRIDPHAEAAVLLAGLRELMGHIEDGSSTPVTLSQDDATKCYVVSVGKIHGNRRHTSEVTMEQAIRIAVEDHLLRAAQ